jgi:hypothetical protein
MGIETALIAATLVSAGASVVQGSQQRKEAKRQAALAEENAAVAAEAERESANTALRQQKMSFLKSGVTLAGSPLLLMQETFERGERNARNQVRTGAAQSQTLRAQGSAAFMQGVSSGFKSVGSAVLQGYDAGMFQKSAAPTGTNPNLPSSQPATGTNFDAYQTA